MSKSHQIEPNVATRLLAPLKRGKAVALQVHDPYAVKKKRIQTQLLYLVPMSLAYGTMSSKILVSLEGRGSEVIDTRNRIRPIEFFRLGLNIEMARAIAKEMNLVFGKGE